MAKVLNILEMEMYTKVNMWTDYPKDMVSIFGMIRAIIKETLNKVLEMVMVFGDMVANPLKNTKDITAWIKNQDMEYMNGKMVGYIKEISIMILEMDLESYMTKINWYIEDIGKMDNKLISKLPALRKYLLKVQIIWTNIHLKFMTGKLEAPRRLIGIP